MLRQPPIEELEGKKVKLGPQERLKTLILDMDETLVHTKFFNVTPEDLKRKEIGKL